jgi:hypothetical protein
VLYVHELKKSLLSVLTMEDKGHDQTFKDGRVLIRPKGSSLDSAQILGNREGNVYKLKAQPTCALVHDNDDLCKLWHKRMGHLQHRALPTLRENACCRPNTHLGYRGRNLQSTWCVLGGKSRVKVLSPDPQLLRLGQLLAKPRGVVPIKRI